MNTAPKVIPAPEESPSSRLLFLAIWLPYAWFVRKLWFVADDAYISFRYSRNWSRGLGLCFNPGEEPAAEGYSNFLTVAWGAALDFLGYNIERWLPLTAFACGSLLLFLVWRCLQRMPGIGALSAFLATAALACATPFAVWSSSGLETIPFALFCFACFERMSLRWAGPAPIAAGLLAVGMSMLRVEGVFWALVLFALFALSSAIDGRRWFKPSIQALGILALGYGLYSFWRIETFGHFFSSTVHSKVAFGGPRLLRGFDYVAVQYLTTLSLPLALLAIPAAIKRGRGVGLAIALLPLGFAAYASLVSGDFMTFGRFLVPGLAFSALLGAYGLTAIQPTFLRFGFGLGAIVLGALPGFDVHPVAHSVRAKFHFRHNKPEYQSEYAQWKLQRDNGIRWAVLGRALAMVSGPGDSVAMGAIGAVAYESDLTIYDRHGFVTPEVALREKPKDGPLRSPGHDNPVEARWFVEHGYDPTFLKPKWFACEDPQDFLRQVRAAEKQLKHGEQLGDRFVVRFWALPAGSNLDPKLQAYLLVSQQLAPDQDPGAEWAGFEDQCKKLSEGRGAPMLDMPPPDYRVAGLPDWLR